MKLGVIGCGQMGTALVGGAIRSGVIQAEGLLGCDPYAPARESFAKATGATVFATVEEMSAGCDVFLLSTKPQDALQALVAVRQARGEQATLILSIAAGLRLAAMQDAAGAHARIIRAMPNTPALVGHGAAAFCRGEKVTNEDAAWAQSLLAAVGIALEVPEKLMDAVTGLSGSGPAYGYLMIEALADGGVKAGLARADALKLAAQTMLGAAAMVLETKEHPSVLKDRVTSPGGTTIAGLAALERGAIRSCLIDAVAAATARSRELGQ